MTQSPFTSGIYAIVHTLSGKRYVGQSRDMPRRWEQHRIALVEGTHHNARLQRLWEDGELAFEFKVIEHSPYGLDPIELMRWLEKAERQHIETYRQSGLALNIVDADQVETRDVREWPAKKARDKAREKAAARDRRSAAAAELWNVKRDIKETASAVTRLTKELAGASLAVRGSSGIKPQGFLRSLFSAPPSAEVQRIAAIQAADRDRERAAQAALTAKQADLDRLQQRHKQLHRSFPFLVAHDGSADSSAPIEFGP